MHMVGITEDLDWLFFAIMVVELPASFYYNGYQYHSMT